MIGGRTGPRLEYFSLIIKNIGCETFRTILFTLIILTLELKLLSQCQIDDFFGSLFSCTLIRFSLQSKISRSLSRSGQACPKSSGGSNQVEARSGKNFGAPTQVTKRKNMCEPRSHKLTGEVKLL